MHSNGEDLNDVYAIGNAFHKFLGMNVIGMEYPGYSLYEGHPSESTIYEDSESLLEFCVDILKFKPSNIIIIGRSIGSGPAIHLNTKNSLGALVLISPFTSIKAVAKNIVGSIGQLLIKERFNNLEKSKFIRSPTLLIHG